MSNNVSTKKISIRFFGDREIRAVWDNDNSKWWFSVLDIVGAIRNEDSYDKCRNYWKYIKAKLKKDGIQLGSGTTQLKLTAPDGKARLTDVLDSDGIITLAAEFPSKVASAFVQWFTKSDETIDGKSKQKAYALFESSFIDNIEVGTVKGLQQIHSYLFGGLYDFAGQIRGLNIAKGGFQFAMVRFLRDTLEQIEDMPESSFDEIVNKYVEMNIAHPFLEGNGRTMRIWLDQIAKKNLKQCIDWSKIDKSDYLNAMRASVVDSSYIKELLQKALTDKINDREVFMKGIDYSYYYEQEETITDDE
ncbi:MAG: Fic family protein [Clostridia bacterium]